MAHELKQIQFKDLAVSDAGSVKAVFATLGVVDHDGDIIMPGAIVNGQAVRISAYGHKSWDGALPVGKGIISEANNELVFDGQFFMDTNHGADTYKTVKGLGALGEWSFGFDIIEKAPILDGTGYTTGRTLKKLNVTEVSPVLLGAGIATRTLDMKSLGTESKTYQEHADMILEAVSDFVKRSRSIADLRTEKGKEPASVKNRDGLKSISAELSKAAGELKRIAETDIEADELKLMKEAAAIMVQIEANELMRSA